MSSDGSGSSATDAEGATAPPTRWRLPLLLCLSYAMLGLAWIVGNPAGSAPDEAAHYLKALAVAEGRPAGRSVDLPPLPSDTRKAAWMKRSTRAVDVPPGLSPVGLQCNALQPSESARCQDAARPPPARSTGLTYVGTHQPFPYLVPGVLARAAHEPVTAIRLARLGNALTSLGLLWVAVALLWDSERGPLSVIGVGFAATPMVVFLASSVSDSGPEIAGGICFCAALLRSTRQPAHGRSTWLALGASGIVLASTRSLGPLWVVLIGLAVVATRGAGTVGRAVRAGGRTAAGSLSAVAVAALLGVAWELTVQPHEPLRGSELGHWLLPSVREIPELLRQQIGVFGSLDAALPPTAYRWWSLMLLVLVLCVWAVGSRRERAALVLLPLTCVGVTVAISALNRSQTGFGMQGRYVLPFTVVVPLVAGETLLRHPPAPRALSPGSLAALLWLPLAGLHALSWYANARRSAVGNDVEWLFIGRSEWTPGIGWYPLVALVTLAAGLMALLAWPALRRLRPGRSALS